MINLITENIDIWTGAQTPKANGGRGRRKKSHGQSIHGIKKLRDLILDLAVRGKLVSQNPDDESASVLLKKIATEKARLIKEGKIKKQKKLPKINEDEKPFDLPDGWARERFGNISYLITDGTHYTPTYISEGIPFLSVKDMSSGILDFSSTRFISKAQHNELTRRCHPQCGDLLLTKVGTTGIPILIETDKTFSIFVSVALIKFAKKQISGNFLSLLIKSPFVKAQCEEGTEGIGNKNLVLRKITALVIVVPPLAEQHRIVAKVDELMALCDRLEKHQTDSHATHQTLVETLLKTLTDAADQQGFEVAWERIAQHFDILFTTEQSIDLLQQTILQLAVMGKLVPQDPDDEPASVLLEKISKEKARLVKEGKIKKQKKLPEINRTINPFRAPKGWVFTRLDNIVDVTSGITKGKKYSGRKTISVKYLRVANVQRGYLDLDHIKEIDILKSELEKFTVFEKDLLITEGGDWDKVGRTTIWRGELPLIVHQNHIFKARCILGYQNEVWLEKYLNSPIAREYFAGSSKQTTNLASINKTQLRGCIVAIPPLAEQHRIVTKVNEFMGLCDTLKSRLNDAQATQVQLADAIVERAVV